MTAPVGPARSSELHPRNSRPIAGFQAVVARLRRLLLAVPAIAVIAALLAPLAHASSTQLSIFEDDTALHDNLAGTLATIRDLGVDVVRVDVNWAAIAPDATSRRPPAGFDAINPADYPAGGWSFYDALDRLARQDGLTVLFTLTKPVPRWAEPASLPAGLPYSIWRPNATDFAAFVRAVGTRYDGRYVPAGQSSPLPAVHMWSIWNEPNYGQGLAPESADRGSVVVGARLYRALLDGAWSGLMASGHRGDTILFGEIAPHGSVNGGNYGLVAPLVFLRALYCVSASGRQLRGSIAAGDGCPSNPAASRRFRAQNPALFDASGIAAHLYAQGVPPNRSFNDRCARGDSPSQYADLGSVGRLERLLDSMNAVYGSHRRLAVYNTEYGYQTDPPQPRSCAENSLPVSPTTAAYYLNWAEYISYRNPRIASFDQYLLADNDLYFATGLQTAGGVAKPTFAAFRTPLYMPDTTSRRPVSLEVWGCVRPAHVDGVRQVQIQFQRDGRGAFGTLRTVRITNPRGYIDVRQRFATSGTVRLAWTDPATGTVYTSRSVGIRIR